jgi:hypothetical protein
LWTEALTNLDDTSGVDYTLRATGDHTIIVRLNYAYEPDGTLPPSAQYDRFARRCGDFARNSHGVGIYVIGNEMNNPREWPPGQPISPENYAACFNLVYRRIKEADPQAVISPARSIRITANGVTSVITGVKCWRTLPRATVWRCMLTPRPDPRLVEAKRRPSRTIR